MREGGRTSTAGAKHNRLRSVLVVAETAVGVMLLIGAGLLLRSLHRLSHVDLGFNPQHVLTANFDLSETRYKPDQMDRFIQELLRRIRTLPGVVNAANAGPLPLSDDQWQVSFNLLDHPVPESSESAAGFYVVAPGFFETMQIPLVRGRLFDDRDQRNAAPTMIINQAFAKQYFANEDPIGRKIKIGAGDGAARANYKIREVVGVVGDIRSQDLGKAPKSAYFVPQPQLMWGPGTLTIRTAGEPSSLTGELRKLLSSMDPDTPIYDVRTLEDYLALDLGRARFQTVLLGLFAAVALLLTAVGLYGVMAYSVTQRTHEIGVRMALGASRTAVLSMVLQRGVLLTLTGIGLGVLGAVALASVIESLLYEIPPRDPFTYIVVCIALGSVAMLASYVPAWRATRVDPMLALRYE